MLIEEAIRGNIDVINCRVHVKSCDECLGNEWYYRALRANEWL